MKKTCETCVNAGMINQKTGFYICPDCNTGFCNWEGLSTPKSEQPETKEEDYKPFFEQFRECDKNGNYSNGLCVTKNVTCYAATCPYKEASIQSTKTSEGFIGILPDWTLDPEKVKQFNKLNLEAQAEGEDAKEYLKNTGDWKQGDMGTFDLNGISELLDNYASHKLFDIKKVVEGKIEELRDISNRYEVISDNYVIQKNVLDLWIEEISELLKEI